MTKFIGYILIIAGFFFGMYAAIWWALIGGLMDIIYAIRADELVMSNVFIGGAKMFFSSIIGYAAAFLLVGPGMVLVQDDD